MAVLPVVGGAAVAGCLAGGRWRAVLPMVGGAAVAGCKAAGVRAAVAGLCGDNDRLVTLSDALFGI